MIDQVRERLPDAADETSVLCALREFCRMIVELCVFVNDGDARDDEYASFVQDLKAAYVHDGAPPGAGLKRRRRGEGGGGKGH